MHLFGKSAFQTVFLAYISSSLGLISLLNHHPVSLRYKKRVSIYFLGLHSVGRFGSVNLSSPVSQCASHHIGG